MVLRFGQVDGNELLLLLSVLVQLDLQFFDFDIQGIFDVLVRWIRYRDNQLPAGLRVHGDLSFRGRLLDSLVGLHGLLHGQLACLVVVFLRSPVCMLPLHPGKRCLFLNILGIL